MEEAGAAMQTSCSRAARPLALPLSSSDSSCIGSSLKAHAGSSNRPDGDRGRFVLGSQIKWGVRTLAWCFVVLCLTRLNPSCTTAHAQDVCDWQDVLFFLPIATLFGLGSGAAALTMTETQTWSFVTQPCLENKVVATNADHAHSVLDYCTFWEEIEFPWL